MFTPIGKLVDVDGHLIHINCTGERVCSYDRAGQPWSELGPQPRTKQQLVYELHTLLANAKVSGPYLLVGHSGGGYLVRLYQAKYPDEVVGIVLAECGHENSLAIINGAVVRL